MYYIKIPLKKNIKEMQEICWSSVTSIECKNGQHSHIFIAIRLEKMVLFIQQIY